MTCEARGSPPLIITWRRATDLNQITKLSDSTHIISSPNEATCPTVNTQQSTIEIESARTEDGAEYICQAQNNLTRDSVSMRVKVNVQGMQELLRVHTTMIIVGT